MQLIVVSTNSGFCSLVSLYRSNRIERLSLPVTESFHVKIRVFFQPVMIAAGMIGHLTITTLNPIHGISLQDRSNHPLYHTQD